MNILDRQIFFEKYLIVGFRYSNRQLILKQDNAKINKISIMKVDSKHTLILDVFRYSSFAINAGNTSGQVRY